MNLSLTQWTGLLIGLGLLIQGARDGYRRGPIRQLASPLALLASALIGWLAGPAVGSAALADSSVPWLLRETVGMLGVGLLVWLVSLAWLWHIGRRPKGVEEAESPVLGSLVGCWTGLLNAATLVLILTAWAGTVEALQDREEASGHWAVVTRDGLAELPGCHGLAGYSPWPEHWRRMVDKARRVLANPEASKALMEQEGVRALAAHPTFYTAWGDPEIKSLLRQGHFVAAARHPKAHAVLNDEAFQRQLLSLDLESAMDKALARHRRP